MTRQKAKTLAAINGTTIQHQLTVLARRMARLSSRPQYTGSVAKAEPFVIL